MKATIAVIVIVLCIIIGFAVVLWLLRPQSVESVISNTLKENTWKVTEIEEMETGKAPVPVSDAGIEKQFHQMFSETIIKSSKDDGMSKEAPVYAVHVAGEKNQATICFDNKGQVLISPAEKTYAIAEGDLYTFIKTQYGS